MDGWLHLFFAWYSSNITLLCCRCGYPFIQYFGRHWHRHRLWQLLGFLPFAASRQLMARSTVVRLLLLLIASSSCCFFTLPPLASAQITHPSEVAALRAVRQQLKDSYGNLNNWTRSTDPCVSNWTGIICAPVDPTDGYLHVQELRLLNLNLSGNLATELGQLQHVIILNFMWNNISGSIPKEIGYMTSLQFLLLSGNQISGPLPDELGFLPNLTKFQLDLNRISGPLPTSFANLIKAKHFHMNNNSISGQIPPELHTLPALIHMLLDNNNLSGFLPPELSRMPNLTILQLNNNNFNGTRIPDTYSNMTTLVKLSLRNCNLQGGVPDLSAIPGLLYLDLSSNQLTGNIPTNKLSIDITTIDLSYNKLIGSIPSNFSGLPKLQRLSLENNTLTGSVPSFVWSNMTFSTNATLTLDFQNNLLSNVSVTLDPPSNVTIKLLGNPLCKRANELNIVQFCGNQSADTEPPGSTSNWSWKDICLPQSCPTSDYYEYVPATPYPCFCAAPLGVGLRLRSPSISDFRPYIPEFEAYMTSNLGLALYQLVIDSFIWTEGPRLNMYLKIFPQYSNTAYILNMSEIQRLTDKIARFAITTNNIFGPYDLLNFTLNGPYSEVVLNASKSGMSRGSLIGIVLGASSCVIAISLAAVGFFFYKKAPRYRQHEISKRQSIPVKIEGVREFGFEELERATNSFSIGNQVGQGGYGKVYKGILADGTIVAIKRAQQGSLQGQKEFFTEIELLSRLHHRNLVSLVGYCNEEGEQMLVYEFMPNGSLHNLLAARFRRRVNFSTRLSIALDSARGILYLHTEADPPIIHRDIKANNILLDLNFRAKVSDFGISRLAPVQDSGGVASHVSTVVKGTPGYFDPEYFLTHKLTEKSDVYSLGIVFLELLTGMQPISHGRNIVREVESACDSGMMLSIIDQSMGAYPSEGIRRLMQLALKCCDDRTEGRPSMLEIVRELENISCTSTSTSTSTPIPTVLRLSGSEAAIPSASASESEAAAAASSSSGISSSSLSILQGQGWAQGAAAVHGSRERESFPSSDLVSDVIPVIRPR